MTQINPDLPDLGQPNWGTPLNSALTEMITSINLNDKVNTEMVSVKFYGAKGDGLTDDSAAIATALAANQGRTLFFPAGNYIVASATRLVLAGNFTTLVGDASGVGTQITFTSASGGLDIGNGTDNIYENRLISISIFGSSTATTVVRARKMYEPHFTSVRIEGSAATAGSCGLELNDCGQLDADRLVIQGCVNAVKITGTASTLIATLRLSNFYNCTNGFTIATGASGGVPKILVESSWFETVANAVNIETGSNSLSIGQIIFRDTRFLQATGDFRLVKSTSHGALNVGVIKFATCSATAYASTVAPIDFSAVENNSGNISVEITDRLDLELPGGNTEPVIKAHATQSWWLFKTRVDRVIAPGGVLVDPARWSGNPYNVGGTWPEPYKLSSTGSPEGVLAAPSGSMYQRFDVGSLYMKASGNGNTGWKLVTQAT